MDIGVDEIREWHIKERGWKDIGYHYVIRRDGTIELGRPVTEVGAHCKGYNKNSIGICLVGGLRRNGRFAKADANFTFEQYRVLKTLLNDLTEAYNAEVKGHRDLKQTDCPTFDVKEFYCAK